MAKAKPKKDKVIEPIIEEVVAEDAVAGEVAAKEEKEEIRNHYVINPDGKDGKWYVIHTYSGHEHSVAIQLMQRVQTMGLESKVHELLIPTQNKIQIKRGKKQAVKEKLFPGYMLIKMVVADDSWLAVRTTQGVTGFVGIGTKPTPLPPEEVKSIQKFMTQEAPKYKTLFSRGEAVKIIDGPFADFLGQVDSIDEAKGKVHVLVSIFGRETPVELDFMQVSKI
jgi:transcription termination/antitermination protein NusG